MIKHQFTSIKSDSSDATLVRPSDWNAEHTVTPFTIAEILSDHNKSVHDALGIDADTVDAQHRILTINADHTHQSTGAQGGKLDHGLSLDGLGDDDHTQYQKESEKGIASGYASLNVSIKVVEQPASITDHLTGTPADAEVTKAPTSDWAFDHVAAVDPHTVYRLESADHSHQSTGLQAGKLDHGLALDGLLDDDHTQYRLESADHTHQSTGLQGGQLDHGLSLTGLTDDDHTQYSLLAGRSGGQTLIGGTGITDILKLQSTSGNGTLTSAAIQLLVGNNGATTALTILNNGKIGAGTTNITSLVTLSENAGNLPAPDVATILHIGGIDNTSGVSVLLDSFGASPPAITFRVSRGTAVSPSALLLDDSIISYRSVGYKATGYSGNKAAIRTFAAENWTDTANGTYITFATTPKLGVALTERLRINDIGNIGIGTSSFGAGAVKVLTLGDGTAPGALASTSSIVSLSGELWGYDAAGNGTQQTPHPEEVLNETDLLIPFPWGYHSKNVYLGKEVLLDWATLVAEVERLSGKKFVIYRDIPIEERRDWSKDQAFNVAAEKEKRINEKMSEEVEIFISEAFEEVPEMKKTESGRFETKYSFDEDKIIFREIPIIEYISTGEFVKKLKDGIRLDEKTGKLYRRRTRKEAEALITVPISSTPPKWMQDRGVSLN